VALGAIIWGFRSSTGWDAMPLDYTQVDGRDLYAWPSRGS
jgi:hypothetical protein